MPQVIQKGKKNMMYVSCDYCDSYISFYVSEVHQHVGEVFGTIYSCGDIRCPSCNHKITVMSDGDWKKGVTNA